MTEETFWEEQTQRGKASIWFVVGPDGTDATLEQLQEPLLFSEDLSKDLGSAKDPPNTHKRPPRKTLPALFSCFLCQSGSPPAISSILSTGLQETRRAQDAPQTQISTSSRVQSCPRVPAGLQSDSCSRRRSNASKFWISEQRNLLLEDFRDADGCSCCGANTDKSWVPRRRRGAAVLGAPDWLKLNRLLSAA